MSLVRDLRALRFMVCHLCHGCSEWQGMCRACHLCHVCRGCSEWVQPGGPGSGPRRNTQAYLTFVENVTKTMQELFGSGTVQGAWSS